MANCVPSGGDVGLSDVNCALQRTYNLQLNMNCSGVRCISGYPGGCTTGAVSLGNMRGKYYVITGDSGNKTSSGCFLLPATSAPYVNIIAIAGGGGGGGGSGRNAEWSGYDWGGGGGGAGGNAYCCQIPVTPGQYIYYTIGAGGSAGSARDGVYSSGSSGGTGGSTLVCVSGTVKLYVTGGRGGGVSPSCCYTCVGGTVCCGTQYLAPCSGIGSPYGRYSGGGDGGKGYYLSPASLTYGTIGRHANGEYYACAAQTGQTYGGGGGGGGVNQADQYPWANGNLPGAPGSGGAVLIWWT